MRPGWLNWGHTVWCGDRSCRPSRSVTIWHMATNGCLYEDPGADYFTRINPDRAKKRAIHQLEAMGYEVTLSTAS
jgi:hypothetical protein